MPEDTSGTSVNLTEPGAFILDKDVTEALQKELQLAIRESDEDPDGHMRREDGTEVQFVSLHTSVWAAAVLNRAFRNIPVCCIDRTCLNKCPGP